jgi:hypothetical protein
MGYNTKTGCCLQQPFADWIIFKYFLLARQEIYIHNPACKAVSRQRLDKHIPGATGTQATTDVLLETVFSTTSAQMCYKDNWIKNSSIGREPPFGEDLGPEAEEQSLLEAVTRQLIVKTLRLEKTWRVICKMWKLAMLL